MIQVGLLTISDRGAAGEYEDRSGPLMAEILATETDWTLGERAVVPDDLASIARMLMRMVLIRVSNLILTSGGTGFAPRDVTPEATLPGD